MREKNNSAVIIISGIIASVIALMSLSIALFVILDKRRKRKEERELEDYLESVIQ